MNVLGEIESKERLLRIVSQDRACRKLTEVLGFDLNVVIVRNPNTKTHRIHFNKSLECSYSVVSSFVRSLFYLCFPEILSF